MQFKQKLAYIVLGVSLAVLFPLFLISCGENEITTGEDEITGDFLTYESLVYGIRIKYPQDWVKKEGTLGGSVVAFSSPRESSSDTFQENLNVFIEELSSQSMTLTEYTELSLRSLKQVIPDISIIDSGTTTLAGNPAYKVAYTGKQAQYSLQWLQIWAIRNNRAYVITYAAELGKYPKFLQTVQDMIDSFEFI